MRKTRFMTLLFLVWSVAFFFVPEFRQGLYESVLGWSTTDAYKWLMRAGRLPEKTLEEAARKAEQQRDARTLAFVAQHPPGSGEEGFRLAKEAVAIDPQYTWIYPKVIFNVDFVAPRFAEERMQMISRLEAWDPDNAFGYCLEASALQAQWMRQGKGVSPLNLDDWAKQTEWRQAMEKAYAAPRYDSYMQRRYDLDRSWLREHGLNKPPTLLLIVASYPIPNLLGIRTYGMLLLKKLGKEAEDAGHLPQAMGYYWTVAHMGERMQLYGNSLIEELIGGALQIEAYQRLIPALRKAGKTDEAATLEYALHQVQQNVNREWGKDPLAQSASYNWGVLMVALSSGLVVAFTLLTATTLIYVNAKRWVRPEIKGKIYQLLTVGENYMPVLLMLACLAFYLSYYPYAANFHHYTTATGDIRNLEPLFYNAIPSFDGPPGQIALPIGNPFRPYAWYAVVGLILAVLAAIPYHRRQT